jgi:hypothetical protein
VTAAQISPSENTTMIHKAITTALAGYTFLEPLDSNDMNQNIYTWWIHDMVIVFLHQPP